MKFYHLLILTILFLAPCVCEAQNTTDQTAIGSEEIVSTEEIQRIGLSMGILGVSPVIGPTVDYAISDKVTIETGFGVPGPGIGFGIKLNEPLVPDRKNLHIGLMVTYFADVAIGYLPVGLSSYKLKGEYLSFDIGPALADGGYIFYANFKVGKKF